MPTNGGYALWVRRLRFSSVGFRGPQALSIKQGGRDMPEYEGSVITASLGEVILHSAGFEPTISGREFQRLAHSVQESNDMPTEDGSVEDRVVVTTSLQEVSPPCTGFETAISGLEAQRVVH